MRIVHSERFGIVIVTVSFCFWNCSVCFVSNGEMAVIFSGEVLRSKAGNVISTDLRGVNSFFCLLSVVMRTRRIPEMLFKVWEHRLSYLRCNGSRRIMIKVNCFRFVHVFLPGIHIHF